MALVGAAWLVCELMIDSPFLHQVGVVGACALFAAAAGRWAPLTALPKRVTPDVVQRRPVVAFVVALLLLAVGYSRVASPPRLGSPATESAAPQIRSNVVLIVLDTVRAASLSLYGYTRDTTPHLRDLAGQATVYTRAIAPGDMTLSTHASMFTGLYARTHGAHFNDEGLGRPLQNQFVTLAELLSEAGYLTIGVVSNHVFFGSDYGLEQGFDTFDVRPAPQYVLLEQMRNHPNFLLRGPVYHELRRRAPASQFERHYRRAAQINAVAFGLLEDVAQRGAPFFLLLNYMDAHWPYVPPPPFDTRWPGKDASFNTSRHHRLLRQVVKERRRHIRDAEFAHLTSQYDGAIAYMDDQVGRVVEQLKHQGIYDDCLLIITSDHGEAFGERDLVEHGIGVYQDQVHVPLLIKIPGARAGSVVDRPVSLVDLMPTVLGVLGRPIPDQVHGRSLRAQTTPEPERVVSESFPNVGFLGARFARVQRAIYVGSMKYIHATTGRRELYDLSADPLETDDLSQRRTAMFDSMQQRLERWLADQPEAPDSEALADEQTIQRLKALGYLEYSVSVNPPPSSACTGRRSAAGRWTAPGRNDSTPWKMILARR